MKYNNENGDGYKKTCKIFMFDKLIKNRRFKCPKV